jgi:hypothetical protein
VKPTGFAVFCISFAVGWLHKEAADFIKKEAVKE